MFYPFKLCSYNLQFRRVMHVCQTQLFSDLLSSLELKRRSDKYNQNTDSLLTTECAWKYFEEGTMSIELLKDGQLQKVYFHVKDKVFMSSS